MWRALVDSLSCTCRAHDCATDEEEFFRWLKATKHWQRVEVTMYVASHNELRACCFCDKLGRRALVTTVHCIYTRQRPHSDQGRVLFT